MYRNFVAQHGYEPIGSEPRKVQCCKFYVSHLRCSTCLQISSTFGNTNVSHLRCSTWLRCLRHRNHERYNIVSFMYSAFGTQHGYDT